MDKLIAALLIVLLFFIPILMKKTIETKQEDVATEEPCTIYITVEGVDEPLPLEEYVLGVVAGEMPMTFHDEALRAQAIAARTYVLRATDRGKKPIEATVSAQVYKTMAERKERWGKEFKRNEKRLRGIIESTEGDIIVYGEEMITAMFFSTSNGKTETAQNYSGSSIPYLQSVESPGEDIVAAEVERRIEMPIADWNKALGSTWNADRFKSLQLVRNQTGRVQKAVSGDFEISGRKMRELLGLASTDFNIAYDITNKIVIIDTKGYGHGVGMSQYGAEAFARGGWTAENIIPYYYSGTKIKKFELDESECLKSPTLANNSK
ncbi:stage II sporulation protein D [Sporosarcina highlanderae]|uniref:Stage II sporulation protein D n=1 Tax=Sporosarcina highlanderae TaxID=3035916 RepID=A0ABT8JLG7_9BACL|nr:stage II sporulation protein D [Sporosarcina highlanderae]MDN4605988.1 stage II sporulation protein D [Sporosarcina highlanderae]